MALKGQRTAGREHLNETDETQEEEYYPDADVSVKEADTSFLFFGHERIMGLICIYVL